MMKLTLLAGIALCLVACKTTTAYQTIGATESAVYSANGAYLTLVVTGQVPTNDVPTVEAAFNDTQLALHTAAALASGGSSAPVPAATLAKATMFTNIINQATGGK